MASYTLVQSISAQDNMEMCSDGLGNLYVISYNTAWASDIRVTKYDIGTDTATDISGTTFQSKAAGSDGELCIVWFKNNLYVVAGDTSSNEVEIWQYDGSGTSWTRRDNQAAFSGTSTLAPYMDADGNRIVYSYLVSGGAGGTNCRQSTDGTSWSDAASTSPNNESSVYYDYSLLDDMVLLTSNGATYYMNRCCWSNISGAGFTIHNFMGTNADYSFFHAAAGATTYYSTNWGATMNAVTSAFWRSSPKACVYVHGGTTWGLMSKNPNTNRDEVRTWNDGTKDFDLDGTPAASEYLKGRICSYDGYLYVLGSTNGIYQRDDAIGNGNGATGTYARFYQGAATLVERFTLPFTGAAPGNMTLDKALGTVVIGADAPAGVMAVYSDHPYPTGTATDTGIPTGTAVTSMKWV